jgi:hypothetical protein
LLRNNGSVTYHPTGAIEVLVGLRPLDLVIQEEARSAAHRLWTFTPNEDIVAYWLNFGPHF